MEISDEIGRKFGTLRVSLTSTCNLGCVYCVEGNPENKKNTEEYISDYRGLISMIHALNLQINFTKVRLTGGEPLLYKDLIPLVHELSLSGIQNLQMTTNGYLLPQKINALAASGLKQINISLDAIDEDVFFRITGRKHVEHVLKGIEMAFDKGIRVKLNTVVMSGLNEHQILPLLEFAKHRDVEIRFLELMKMGHLYSRDFDNYFYPEKYILEQIRGSYNIDYDYRKPHATARTYVLEDGYQFGIIANESDPFCSDCDRLRLDSEGNLYGCLSESKKISIRDIYHNREQLGEKLKQALAHKQKQKFSGSNMKMIEIGG